MSICRSCINPSIIKKPGVYLVASVLIVLYKSLAYRLILNMFLKSPKPIKCRVLFGKVVKSRFSPP